MQGTEVAEMREYDEWTHAYLASNLRLTSLLQQALLDSGPRRMVT